MANYYVPAKYTVTETFIFGGNDFYRSSVNPSPGLDYYSLVGGIYETEDHEKYDELREAGIFDTVVYDPSVCSYSVSLSNYKDSLYYDASLYFDHYHDIFGGRLVKENEPTTYYKRGLGCIYHKVTQTIHSTNENEYESIFIDYGKDYDSSGITVTVGYGTHETVLYDSRSAKVDRGPYFITPRYYPLKNGVKNVGSADPFTVTVTTTHEIIHVIPSAEYESVMAALSTSENVSIEWLIDDNIPYIDGVPKTIGSIADINDEWVIFNGWKNEEWTGLTSFDGQHIWSDGENYYYSNGSDQYVLDKETSTWTEKEWTGYAPDQGKYVWSDGESTYYSNVRNQYVLDKSTSTWSTKTWTGLRSFYGSYVWKSSGGGIYYSNSSTQYVLNKSTGAWVKKTWSGVSQPGGIYIWTDGVDTYYSKGTAQYVLNTSTSKWVNKTWAGLTNFYGHYIWSDGENYYYSNGSDQYVLDKETSTWNEKTWNGLTSFNGQYIWTDDENYYYSNGSDQYVLNNTNPFRLDFPETNTSESHIDYTTKWVITDDIPYRLDFPTLKASRDAKHDWYIDDDIPFQGGFPELHESEKFDLHDKWVADKENEDTGDLIFLKLTIPFTVTVNAGSDTFTLSTDFDNRKINYFDSRKNYGTRDCQLSVKLEYNVPIYQMDFTKSNNLVSDMGGNGMYLFPRSDTPTTGRCTYQNTNYASEDHVWSYKNTDLQEPEYNNYYKSYLCVGEFDCRNIRGAATSGSTDFTYGFIFAFHSNIPTDMDKYDRMLEYYEGYIEPFYYTRSSVPYRLDFPPLNESIPGTDIWVIDDDIPYRIEFPPLNKSNGGLNSWLQNTGYEPYRPWPNHKTIFQSVQPVEVPDIDWTRGMQQTFEYFKVNPKTWNDAEQITTIISSNITKDTDSEMRGHASIEISELIDECYIRTYLKVKQDNFTRRICLGTHLYMMQSDSFNGMRHQYNMTGYTPLVELREKLAAVGYSVTGTTGEVNGKVAPMISDEIVQLLRQNTRLKVDDRVQIKQPLLNNFVTGTSDNLLTVVNNMLNATSLQKYEMNVTERGEVYIREAITVYNERHVFEYTDDNSSILMADIDLSVDMSSIPNVLEVIYCGDKNKDIGAIRVVVRNEDPNSIVSTVARGREIWSRYTISNIATPVNTTLTKEVITAEVEAQAKRLLEAASTIKKTIQYEHGFCDVEIGDTVLFNYKRAGLIGIKAKVVSQTITCKPGCKVSEMAVYTKKLWNRGV